MRETMAGSLNRALGYPSVGDGELARLCAARDADAIRHVITSNNQRMFRTAWSILKQRAEAEDAVQAAYLSAFAKIGTFEGRSSLSTWLTRIVINEALGRRRSEERRRRNLEEEGIAVLDGRCDRPRTNPPIIRASCRRAAGHVPHGVRPSGDRGAEQ